MQRTFWLLATLLCGVGLLLAFQQTRLSINGKETRDFVVSNGKVYVAVAALRDAGAVVTNNQNQIDIQFEPIRGVYKAT